MGGEDTHQIQDADNVLGEDERSIGLEKDTFYL